ncbi:MAG: tetratricopeptide repeat protein [Acidobacteriaceae bacterium]
MSRVCWLRWACCSCLATCVVVAVAQEPGKRTLDREYRKAVGAYEAGQYPVAAQELEAIAPEVHNNFDLEELMGLVYAAMSQDEKAMPHLEAAVKLRPNEVAARTNLAASLTRLGRTNAANEQFRAAVALAPKDYTVNHNLGEFYIQAGKIAEGRPYLAAAYAIDPTVYDNGYDLAMADMLTSQYADAHRVIQQLLKSNNKGELHNLEGQVAEKDGQYVEAANEFEAAAHMDPSEENLFDWGSELLLHRTYDPAIEVFKAAVQRYPRSARMQIGLGMCLYARGLYEDAVKALLLAADLAPNDPRVYLFLSRAYDGSPSQVDAVIQHFKGYAEREPDNALAQYYYAMSIWKGKRSEGMTVDLTDVQALLKRSIVLDGRIADAHMQLGNLYADQHDYAQSVPQYQETIQLDPTLADAHYRLGTDYTHMGKKTEALAEFDVYKKLRANHMAAVDKERAEVKEFVYSSKATAGSSQEQPKQ